MYSTFLVISGWPSPLSIHPHPSENSLALPDTQDVHFFLHQLSSLEQKFPSTKKRTSLKEPPQPSLISSNKLSFCSSLYLPSSSIVQTTYPTNNALLINFRLTSDADILLISTDWAYKSVPSARKKRACIAHIFQLSFFHFAYHRWWLGTWWELWKRNWVGGSGDALQISFRWLYCSFSI